MLVVLTKRDLSVLRSLERFSRNFPFERDFPGHFCAAVSGKQVVIARNTWNKTSSNAEIREFYKYPEQLHAEFNACRNLDSEIRSVYVVRFNRRWELRNSLPCRYCMEYLRHKKVRFLVYSVEGGFVKIKL
jgi:hypothetical protein